MVCKPSKAEKAQNQRPQPVAESRENRSNLGPFHLEMDTTRPQLGHYVTGALTAN